MITTQNLTKKFDQITAVKNLTLEIPEGEVFGFLGPNGAGKTTTIRMLTSLISPTTGSASVNGHIVGEQDIDIRRSVGLLTETPGLYNNLSAERNLQIYASLYEVEDIKGQVEKYLRFLGLWERRLDLAATFSKGMKQKLAIARALLHEPRTLFLDEPTAGLDPEASRLVREFILEIKQEGRTIFICTHNLDEADRLCDRIGVFKTSLLVFGRKVVFHLQQADEALVEKLKQHPHVTEAQLIDQKIVTTIEDPETYNPEIIRFLVSEGADVQFVGELRRSLEDVYLQLVKDA